jgi:glycosyltransferase involved in cell wall biosynthesis
VDAIFEKSMSLKISIVTVCLNAADVIDRCLSSVANQTYPHIEYLLIDGVSTDGTLDIIQKYEKSISYFVSEEDGGIYPAMNKGIAKATGDFVLILGADDYLVDDNVIEDVVAGMQNETADFYYGLLEVRYPNGEVSIYDAGSPAEIGQMMILGCLPSQASLMKRAAFDDIGVFDTQYCFSADYDWYLKALNTPGFKFAKIDRLCSSYFMGGASSNLEKCRSEMDLIQNRSAFYQTPQWHRRLIETWQGESLSWRLKHDDVQSRLDAKRKAAHSLVEDKNEMVVERERLLQEIKKLREGLDALDAERNKLQDYLNDANAEARKLARELEQRNEQPARAPLGLRRAVQLCLGILRK